jgi:uncharacterized protein (TIGR00251 family)
VLGTVRERGKDVILTVQVVARSSRDEMAGIHGDALRIRLRAPPVEGAANTALIAFLAETLGVRQRQVEILSGYTSRRKTVLVSGLCKEQVVQKLSDCLH